MAIENINVGVTPNDGTGTPLRNAFEIVNDNFDQVEADLALKADKTELANYDTKDEVNTKISNATTPIVNNVSNLTNRVINVENEVDQIQADLGNTATISYVDALAALKADKANTYTKTEVDTALATKANQSTTYTKAEVDSALAPKLNDAPSDGKTYGRKDGQWSEVTGGGTGDVYTKAESDALFTTKDETTTWVNHFNNQNISLANQMVTLDEQNVKISGNQAVAGIKTFTNSPVIPAPTTAGQATNKTYVDNALGLKANQTEISRIDGELASKASNTSVNTLDAQNVKITGNQSIGGVKSFTSSPTVPTPTVDNQVATKKYVDDAVSGGGDLTNYYTKTQTDNLLAPKANTTTVNTLDAQNVKITGNQSIGGVKTFSSSPIAPTAVAANEVVIKQQMDSALTLKANQSTTYTKSEVDSAVATKVDQTYFNMFESETEADIIALENLMPTKADVATTYTKTEVDNKFWFGTQAQYDAIITKNPNILYFIEEI